jgi:hypothetical protein
MFGPEKPQTLWKARVCATLLRALAVNHKRLDDVLSALYFELSRKPEIFPTLPGTSLSVVKTAVYSDAPALRIFFTYTEAEVHLIHIEFAE